MSDTIIRAASVIWATSRRDEGTISAAGADIIAHALTAAGLLVTPAHDAEIAAKALREAADGFSDPDDPCFDPEPLNEVAQWLRLMAAERIEREGGSDV